MTQIKGTHLSPDILVPLALAEEGTLLTVTGIEDLTSFPTQDSSVQPELGQTLLALEYSQSSRALDIILGNISVRDEGIIYVPAATNEHGPAASELEQSFNDRFIDTVRIPWSQKDRDDEAGFSGLFNKSSNRDRLSIVTNDRRLYSTAAFVIGETVESDYLPVDYPISKEVFMGVASNVGRSLMQNLVHFSRLNKSVHLALKAGRELTDNERQRYYSLPNWRKDLYYSGSGVDPDIDYLSFSALSYAHNRGLLAISSIRSYGPGRDAIVGEVLAVFEQKRKQESDL